MDKETDLTDAQIEETPKEPQDGLGGSEVGDGQGLVGGRQLGLGSLIALTVLAALAALLFLLIFS